MKCLTCSAAFVALALAAAGCFNAAPPQTAPYYAGPDEYAAYGYASDPSFAAYDPFIDGYYWPVPYYYYWQSGGDGDRDCDDGFCGPRIGRKPPHLPLTVRSLAERLPPRGDIEAAPGTVSGQSAQPVPSTPATTIDSGLSGFSNSHIVSAPSAGFGGGGFHSDGFGGGGFRGSFRR